MVLWHNLKQWIINVLSIHINLNEIATILCIKARDILFAYQLSPDIFDLQKVIKRKFKEAKMTKLTKFDNI